MSRQMEHMEQPHFVRGFCMSGQNLRQLGPGFQRRLPRRTAMKQRILEVLQNKINSF